MGKEGQQCFRLIYNTHKSHTAPAYLKDTTFHVHVNVYYRVSLSSLCCIYVCVSLSIWTLTTFSSHYQFFAFPNDGTTMNTEVQWSWCAVSPRLSRVCWHKRSRTEGDHLRLDSELFYGFKTYNTEHEVY